MSLDRGEVAVPDAGDLHAFVSIAVIRDADKAAKCCLQLTPRTERLESHPADVPSPFINGAAFEAGAVAERLVAAWRRSCHLSIGCCPMGAQVGLA